MGLFEPLGRVIRARLASSNDDSAANWPFVPGKYRIVDRSAPVVVATMGRDERGADLASLAPPGLCMVAELHSTRDVEKLIRNLVSNLAVQRLIVAGTDSPKQPLGEALLRILADGQHDNGKADVSEEVISAIQELKTRVIEADIQACRDQVKAIDLLGAGDVGEVLTRIAQAAAEAKRPNVGFVVPSSEADEAVEQIIAAENVSYEAQPDKAGDFVIRLGSDRIIVEHYGQHDKLLRVVEGTDARDLCLTLIRNGWVSKLDHAAYLGRELMRAELALRRGEAYTQSDDQHENIS